MAQKAKEDFHNPTVPAKLYGYTVFGMDRTADNLRDVTWIAWAAQRRSSHPRDAIVCVKHQLPRLGLDRTIAGAL